MTMATEQPKIALTDEQEAAVDAALRFLDSGKRLFRIGGYAGTGKTTLANAIVERAKGMPGVCAFTGKAASVLRRKGLEDAHTIHATIYEWDKHREKFVLRRGIPYRYFLVDEGSMVSRQLWDDMQVFDLPIIVIGDPGQLEPVGDDPRLMHDCDIVLEQIHRQAENSAIIEFANKVRHGASFRHGTKGEVSVVPAMTFWQSLDWADHVLCGLNRTRVEANAMIRESQGRRGRLTEGERIIVLRNDRNMGVWNGQMLTVDRIREKASWQIVADCRTDDDEPMPRLPIYTGQLGSETKLTFAQSRRIRDVVIADYGYCTTVHKFQGSEADRVLVADEQCDVWDPIRWRYTAITRAAKELRYCI